MRFISINPQSWSLSITARHYHIGRATSVHSAIHRGLRKSRGKAFVGKAYPNPDDPREKYKRKHGIPDFSSEPRRKPFLRQKSNRDGKYNSQTPFTTDWRDKSKPGSGRSYTENFNSSQRRPSDDKLDYSRSHQANNLLRQNLKDNIMQESSSIQHNRGKFQQRESFNSQKEPSYKQNFSRPRHEPSDGLNRRAIRAQKFGKRDDSPVDRETASVNSWSSDNKYDTKPRNNFSTNYKQYEKDDVRKSTETSDYSSRTKSPFNSFRHQNPSQTQSRYREPNREAIANQNGRYNREGQGNTTYNPTNTTYSSNVANSRPNTEFFNPRTNTSDRPGYFPDKKMPIPLHYTTPASEFLYGFSVVEAALTSRRDIRRKLYKLYISSVENRELLEQDKHLQQLAKSHEVPIVRVNEDGIRMLDKMSNGRPHNGYILEASPLPKIPVTSLLEVTTSKDEPSSEKPGFRVQLDHQSREEKAINGTSDFIETLRTNPKHQPLVLMLDSILDPGNLGGIIRTASFFGVSAIAISLRNTVSFTPVVLKASAGASEHTTILSVGSPAEFIAESRNAGWKIYAAVPPIDGSRSSQTMSVSSNELSSRNPLVEAPSILMIGNEGEGLRRLLRNKADVEVFIPGIKNPEVKSLNVTVATGILCDAFLKDRDDHENSLAPQEIQTLYQNLERSRLKEEETEPLLY
ncbi:BgTH12-00673 [Blumeria graminis f. sp. triticale]|uniref:rRNA methyltransferase 1, mitochondrial n=1 Tax=Blumeria graminis f. sp. triticale TaxID=1689686 RepID=A0A9W4GHR9_BLUGR|nr:BgTH12-00673 [Blumeria graminis f. sp. triticale]